MVTYKIGNYLVKNLGEKWLTHFREYLHKYGTISPLITGRFPHPVHFREGMVIRNKLRECELCKDWSSHDFDNEWQMAVLMALYIMDSQVEPSSTIYVECDEDDLVKIGWHACPKCLHDKVVPYSNYCPYCGIGLKWEEINDG